LGGTEERAVDVAFVAATNRDLGAAARAGASRRDLYYRLNVVRLDLPPLRERREDVAPLADHFLRELAARFRKTFTGFAPDALRRLEAHAWPGNVRELRNAIERVVLLFPGPLVTPELLVLDDEPAPRPPVAADPAPEDFQLETAERAA